MTLLRERAHPIPPGWRRMRAFARRSSRSRGRLSSSSMSGGSLARLLALANLITAARSQNVWAEDGHPLAKDV